jgi:hypothetical protein
MKQLTLDIAFDQETKFADYCRTGNYVRLKGTTPNRLPHYRKLVFNVIDDTLQTAYPLTFGLLTKNEWKELVNDFFGTHNCQSYQVWKMPFELYEFVLNNDLPIKEKYPQLLNLLLFEWMEIEVFMMEDIEAAPFKTTGELITDELILNPEHFLLTTEYPVHYKKAKEITSADKSIYYILIFREPQTGKVIFIELSVLFAWLVEQIKITGKSVYQSSKEASEIFNIPQQQILENSQAFLNELYQQQFILGFKS